MKTKNFEVTATSAWAWDGPVSVIYYESGVDSAGALARIRVRSPDGSAVDLEMKPGRQASWPLPIAGVVIESLTGNSITGKISIGNGDVKDSSVVGSVEVIDGGKARTTANAANSHWTLVGGTAGQLSAVQLWNPVGSGRKIIVEKVTMASTISTGFVHAAHNAALATIDPVPAQSKLLGATSVAAGQPRKGTEAARLGVDFALSNAAVNTGVVYQPPEPIVLLPGWGHCIWGNTVNSDVSVTWDWFEEAA